MRAKILACSMLLVLGNGSLVVRGQDDYWFQKALKARQPDKKIEYFTKSIKTEGAKVVTYLNRGDVYWNLAIDAAYNSHLVVIVFDKDKAYFHNAKLMYDEAKKDYTRAMEIDTSCAKAYIKRSDVYWQLGQTDNALADLSHLIAIDTDNAEAYYKRCFIYRNNLRDNDKALADIFKAIEIDSNYEDAYRARGYIYFTLGQYGNSMADYNKLVKINPNDAYAYCRRGDVYRMTGQYDRAIVEYNMVIEIDRKNYMAYNNRGLVYLIQSQYEKALKDFKKAISVQPSDFPFTYNNAGYVYLQQEKIDLAIKYFNKSLSIEDKFFAPNVNLALVYYGNGEKERAKYYLDLAVESYPSLQEAKDDIFKFNQAWFYWTGKDKETLAEMFVEFK
jgi:tetratricopeptide (TPR) repeat protein